MKACAREPEKIKSVVSTSYPELDPAQRMNFLPQMTPLLCPDVKHFSLFEILPAMTYSQKYKLDAGSSKTISTGSTVLTECSE